MKKIIVVFLITACTVPDVYPAHCRLQYLAPPTAFKQTAVDKETATVWGLVYSLKKNEQAFVAEGAVFLKKMAGFLQERTVEKLDQENLQRFLGSRQADILILFGHDDLGVVEAAARFYKEGLVRKSIIVSGGRARLTIPLIKKMKQHLVYKKIVQHIPESALLHNTPDYWNKLPQHITEAFLFKNILIECGVPSERILLEETSTYTFQNAQNVCALLKGGALFPTTSCILMTIPLQQRRARVALEKAAVDSGLALRIISYAAFCHDDYAGVSMYEMQCHISNVLAEINKIFRDSQGQRDTHVSKGDIHTIDMPPDVMAAYENLTTYIVQPDVINRVGRKNGIGREEPFVLPFSNTEAEVDQKAILLAT